MFFLCVTGNYFVSFLVLYIFRCHYQCKWSTGKIGNDVKFLRPAWFRRQI